MLSAGLGAGELASSSANSCMLEALWNVLELNALETGLLDIGGEAVVAFVG